MTARISVESAIAPSEIMTRYLRLCRSAHTPANREIRICGRKLHRLESMIITPDEVDSVTYQTMANWVMDEPNRETAWLDRNQPAFCRQWTYSAGRGWEISVSGWSSFSISPPLRKTRVNFEKKDHSIFLSIMQWFFLCFPSPIDFLPHDRFSDDGCPVPYEK